MKTALPPALLCVLLSAVLVGAEEVKKPDELKTPKEKASYTLGLNVSKRIAGCVDDLDSAALIAAFRDAIAGKPGKLTDDEVDAQVDVFKKFYETKMAASAGTPPKPPAPLENKDKVSLALGQSFGAGLKQFTEYFDIELVIAGFTATAKKETPIFNPDTERDLINTYFKKVQADFGEATAKKNKELAPGNKKASDEFLAANKTKDGVVTTASGLQYKILKEGNGAKMSGADMATVQYEGKLLNGKVFDSSIKRGQPMEIGLDRVFPGWAEALQLMPEGSKWELYIPPGLAYGEEGAGGVIPPNSVLIFTVEVLSVKKVAPDPAKKAGEDFLAENKKKEGVVTTASGLQYKILKAGTGAICAGNDMATVHYEGRFIDGKIFDSSIKRNEPFETGLRGVIPGWIEALKLMPAGSKWELYIPSSLAYGPQGMPGAIPPNSVLIFTLEVLSVKKVN